jgi:hypothetical protein
MSVNSNGGFQSHFSMQITGMEMIAHIVGNPLRQEHRSAMVYLAMSGSDWANGSSLDFSAKGLS